LKIIFNNNYDMLNIIKTGKVIALLPKLALLYYWICQILLSFCNIFIYLFVTKKYFKV